MQVATVQIKGRAHGGPPFARRIDQAAVQQHGQQQIESQRQQRQINPAGDCQGKAGGVGDSGNGGRSAKGSGKGKGANSTSVASLSVNFPNELLAEVDGAMSEEQVRALARRHGLDLVESQNFPLIGATIGLFRITNGRPLEDASVKKAIDAGKEQLGGKGRLVIRPSGTEPVIRVMAEGDDETLVHRVVGDIVEAVQAAAGGR